VKYSIDLHLPKSLNVTGKIINNSQYGDVPLIRNIRNGPKPESSMENPLFVSLRASFHYFAPHITKLCLQAQKQQPRVNPTKMQHFILLRLACSGVLHLTVNNLETIQFW